MCTAALDEERTIAAIFAYDLHRDFFVVVLSALREFAHRGNPFLAWKFNGTRERSQKNRQRLPECPMAGRDEARTVLARA